MQYIILAMCILATCQKQISLNYNHKLKLVQLYDSNDQPINLQLTFETDTINLVQSLRGQDVYLNRHRKYKIEKGDENLKYDYRVKGSLSSNGEVEISGIIGLKEGSSLFPLLKKVLGVDRVKLAVKHKEGSIAVIAQSCNYPVFAPLTLTISQTNTRSYTVDSFSTNFHPDNAFLKVINQQKSPFELPASTLQEAITLSVRDRIISIKMKEILDCGWFSKSQTYECEVSTSDNTDMGGLLFNFDPVLCPKGMELQQSSEQTWGYQNSHMVLLGLQLVLLACLAHEDKVLRIITKLSAKQIEK